MIDKASIIKEAQKYLAKGQIDKAIAEWEKLLSSSPDGNTFNFIGDLYLKKGDKQKATENYHGASEYFRKEGFTLKALALYKKILNINPSDADALFSLGQLNEDKNITTDAIKYYLAAFDIYSKENKKDKLLLVYGRIVKLAPSNLPLRIKIAELFSKYGHPAEASNEYRNIGLLFEQEGDAGKCKEYLLKSIELQPGNRETLLSLVEMSEKQEDLAGALKYLKNAIEKTGESKELLIKNARILSETGDLDAALRNAVKGLDKDPSDIDSRIMLADIYQKTGDIEKAWAEYLKVVDGLESQERFEEAINILNSFKIIGPLECRQRLVTLYKREHKDDLAFSELIDLCQIHEEGDRKTEALSCLRSALEMQPDDALVVARIDELEKQLGMKTAPEAEEKITLQTPEFEATSQPQAEFEEDHVKTVDEILIEADIFIRYGLYPDARKLLEGLKLKEPSNIEAHLKLKTLYSATDETENVVTECIILSELYGREGDLEKKKVFLSEAFELNPEDPRLAGRLEEKPSAPVEPVPEELVLEDKIELPSPEEAAPAEEADPSLDDFSDEIAQSEFYYKEGLYKEAEDILGRLIVIFPKNEDLNNMMQEVQKSLAAQTPEKEMAKPTIVEPLDPPLDSEVLEIFEAFKKGLEKEVSAEDSETHYNLGIAYREMDLVDDAIKSFQTARKDPKFFMSATSMLGICYMQKGLYPLAIDSFQSALMKVKPDDESLWGLKYELAGAYEKSGNPNEALRLYTEVYGWNSEFRDSTAKIETLRKSIDTRQKEKGRRSRVSYI